MTDRDSEMERKNYLFIHIPKTAGRSIVMALGLTVNNQHRTITDYVNKIGLDAVRQRFKFTCVRNPWDRAVSWYSFFGSMGPGMQQAFDKWLLKFTKWSRPAGVRFPLDQSSFLRTNTGEILIDKFIRFEHLREDWNSIASMIGADAILGHVGKMDRYSPMKRHLNPSPIPYDYREMYTSDNLIEIVATLDSEIITRFGYRFEDGPAYPPPTNAPLK